MVPASAVDVRAQTAARLRAVIAAAAILALWRLPWIGVFSTGFLIPIIWLTALAIGVATVAGNTIAAVRERRSAQWMTQTALWLAAIPVLFALIVVLAGWIGSLGAVTSPQDSTVEIVLRAAAYAVPIILLVMVAVASHRGAVAVANAFVTLLLYVTVLAAISDFALRRMLQGVSLVSR